MRVEKGSHATPNDFMVIDYQNAHALVLMSMDTKSNAMSKTAPRTKGGF
jgi:hypothetical protein